MDFASSFRVTPRSRPSLKSVNPRDTTGVKGKTEAEMRLGAATLRLAELQERMFALRTWALLLVFQAMDAAGKDGTIKHVLSAVNPRGCRVVSFGVPSDEDLNHDYLWRTMKALPERGIIAAHNRSHYEEVIVTRVHPRVLERQRMPESMRGPDLIARRYRAINRFEQHLVDNGTIVLKFFLHISKREQWRRLRDRMEDPDKYWKLQAGDFRERLHWEKYYDRVRGGLPPHEHPSRAVVRRAGRSQMVRALRRRRNRRRAARRAAARLSETDRRPPCRVGESARGAAQFADE
jgi:PPK2 family polyphosphate:nucleotide phosphotransferase